MSTRMLIASVALFSLSVHIIDAVHSNLTCLYSITITKAPPKGSGEDSYGTICGTANYTCESIQTSEDWSNQFSVILWSITDEMYIQPLENNFYTPINPNGDWCANIHLGYSYEAWLVSFDNVSIVLAIDNVEALEINSTEKNLFNTPVVIVIVFGIVFLAVFCCTGYFLWIKLSEHIAASTTSQRIQSKTDIIDKISSMADIWQKMVTKALLNDLESLKGDILRDKTIISNTIIQSYYEEAGNNILKEVRYFIRKYEY